MRTITSSIPFVVNSVVASLIAQCEGDPKKVRFTNEVSSDFLKAVRENVFPGQRHHGKSAPRKHFLGTLLWGDQLTFTAVYVRDEQKTWLIDGNNRVERIISEKSHMPAGESGLLITHVVESMADAYVLYDMFNSLAAAKGSGDSFDSGLRQVGALYDITSPLVCKGGRATGAQLAFGKRGSRYTKEATVALIDGIRAVDSLGLIRNREIAGQLGAYFAIAQHTFDKDLAADFIKDCNERFFHPKTVVSERDLVVIEFRRWVETHIAGGTGAKPNDSVFGVALAMFVEYATASTKPVAKADVLAVLASVPSLMGISLATFIDAMAALK